MAYTKTNWINGQAPALSAENLNKIEEGIYNADAGIAALRADMADYVAEKGTSGDWTYRKWSNGTFEAWMTSSHTGSITSQSGSFYYLNGSLSLPSIGISTIEFASIEYYGPELTFSKLGNVSTTAIGFTFISSVSRPTAAERTYFAYVIGTYS